MVFCIYTVLFRHQVPQRYFESRRRTVKTAGLQQTQRETDLRGPINYIEKKSCLTATGIIYAKAVRNGKARKLDR